MTPAADTRNLRWNLRVAESENDLVREAAELSGEGFTGFVREAAVEEAKRVLADRQVFPVADSDWVRFNDLLERPARVPDGLRELFAKPSVFDE